MQIICRHFLFFSTYHDGMSIQSTCQDIVSMFWNFIDTAINYSLRIVFRKVNLHKKGTKLIRAFEIKLEMAITRRCRRCTGR